MTVLVISNAGAARARRGIASLREALPEGAGNLHQITRSAAELTALVSHDRWHPDDMLVINGGDGTVQHALTDLAAGCPAERWPRIACLPGGTTNMTAYDLNTHRRFEHCVHTLRRALEPGDGVPPAPRPVVRVRDADGALRCGLFFGTGSIVRGIEYFQQRIRHNGGAHELGAGAALVRTLWGIARREPPFAQPLAVSVVAPGLLPSAQAGEACEVMVRLLLATTLDRLFLGMRPYWDSGPGALKATLVEDRARRFVRSMPRLLRGQPGADMTAARGYHSARPERLTLTFRGTFTLDGELFGNPGETIDVSASPQVKFVPL